MSAQISFNPVLTTNAAGSFGVDWGGYIQGMALNDPAVRYQLAGGYLASSETLPMWGGVGISEAVPTPPSTYPTTYPQSPLGGPITRATVIAQGAGQLTGFSVFDQNNAAINFPQSPVPLLGSGQLVNFYRFGSNARILLQIDPVLVNLYGDVITQPVSWDFVNQRVIDYIAAYASEAVTSATYTSSTGIIAYTFGTAPFGASIGSGANGVQITVTGLAGTGVAPLNGTWPITGTASSGTVISVQGPIGLGSLTITGSTGTLLAGGGAVPCKGVIRVESANSMTVVYSFTTGFATWNRSGSVAQVLI